MKTTGVLLVEGSDDLHVIWALLKHHNVSQTFKVDEMKGIDNIFKTFPVLAKGSEVSTIGIVIDADTNIISQWARIRKIIGKLGYASCPEKPPKHGLVLDEIDLPRVGVWLMPDNSLCGMLEDFIAFLVPPADKLWEHVDQAIQLIPNGLAEFKEIHTSKAKIHTWLAWKEDPGTPMGLAITKKWLDPDATTAKPFMNWITTLFTDQ